MWDPSFVRASALTCVVVFAFFTIECTGFVIPGNSEEGQIKVSLPESTGINSPPPQVRDFPITFQNETSPLRLVMLKMQPKPDRVKRETSSCKDKDRPITEVLQYEDLKLPNRCWEDCDCRVGRYCTKHNWCHDNDK